MPNISASKSTSQCHTFPPPSQHAPRRRLLPKDRGDAAVEGLERQHQVHVPGGIVCDYTQPCTITYKMQGWRCTRTCGTYLQHHMCMFTSVHAHIPETTEAKQQRRNNRGETTGAKQQGRNYRGETTGAKLQRRNNRGETTGAKQQ
eukprot:CAMPEP_0113676614 /NCGR_PEP_ID=MMETSP0038_2-20120614/8749_1 /TAXON_ID=2898 /ORGANISM="Cryptomonas paramecium" /LENGTH=145 /DNA_ID=CAMNT_0000593679 /DNA_START=1047 /DNA_END=1481 /DNA_ORIENTATION=+ /assembly_acc=CAM_ASM_000170